MSDKLQSHCEESLTDSKHKELRLALVCGTPIVTLSTLRELKQSGLLHAFVVSGGHLTTLLLLSQLLPTGLRWLVLLLFCGFAGLQPPIVRALAFEALKGVSRHLKWGQPPGQLHLGSCLLPLGLYPHWIGSWSYFLSCWASTSLLFSEHFKSQSWLLKTFLLQMLIGIGFGVFSVKFWIGNLIFGPILTLIAFPMAAVCSIHRGLAVWSDFFFETLLMALSFFNRLMPETELEPSFSQLPTLWILLALFFAFERFLGWRRWRGQVV